MLERIMSSGGIPVGVGSSSLSLLKLSAKFGKSFLGLKSRLPLQCWQYCPSHVSLHTPMN